MNNVVRKLSLFLLSIIWSSIGHSEILEIYSWKPHPGKANELMASMQEAAEIHADLGISVIISALGIGTSGDIDYVLSYEDIESWGKLKDAINSSQRWNAFYQRLAENPFSELIQSFMMTNHHPSNKVNSYTQAAQLLAFLDGNPRWASQEVKHYAKAS